MQSLIEQGQRAGTFRRDMPQQWLITTTYSLMHAAAEDTAAGRLDADDAAGLITATLLAAFTPHQGGVTRPVRHQYLPNGPQPWLVTAFVDGPSLADAVASGVRCHPALR